MRSLMLSFTTLAGLAVVPAMAQTNAYPPQPAYPPGQQYGQSPGMMMDQGGAPAAELPAPPSHQPMVRHPTNINESNTRSVISPSLPQPPVGPNANASQFLQAAMSALQGRRLGEAQAALENAATWLLNRSVPLGQTNQPVTDPAIQNIHAALNALAARDVAQTMNLVQQTVPMAQADESRVSGSQAAMNNGYGQPPMTNYGQPPAMNYGQPPAPPVVTAPPPPPAQ